MFRRFAGQPASRFLRSVVEVAGFSTVARTNTVARINAVARIAACLMVLAVAGCNQPDPSRWSQAQVETEIKEQWDLSEITLAPSAGGFTGKGKDENGESYEITVKQDTAAKSLSYTGKGDRGTNLENSLKFN